MNDIKVSGKTVSDALTEALIQLGTTSDKVDYEVLEKGSAGFLGFGQKPAVLRVWKKEDAPQEKKTDIKEAIQQELKNDREDRKDMIEKTAVDEVKKEEPAVKEKKVQRETPKKEQPAEKKEAPKKEAPKKETSKKETPKKAAVQNDEKASAPTPSASVKEEKEVVKFTPEEAEAVKARVERFLKDVFKAMDMPVEMSIRVEEATRTVSVEVEGSDMGLLIGKRGQTLDSLQYLISLVANKGSKEYIRVKLDTENYRKRRKATLENLAKNIAYKVKRDRKPVVLEPMNPYERRVIHSTLQNDRFVETHSEGVEPYRHIVVTLKKH